MVLSKMVLYQHESQASFFHMLHDELALFEIATTHKLGAK